MIPSTPGRLSLLLAMSLLLSAFPAFSQAAEKQPPKGPPPALVATAPVEVGRLQMPQLLVGSSEPRRIAEVAAETSGLVIKVAARQGARVKKGDVLVQLRDTRQKLLRDEARARLAEVASRLRKAEADAKRAEGLFDSKFISDEELQARLTERDTLLRQQDQLRAVIRLIEDKLARMVIRAPFDGQVVAEKTEEGEWLGEGDPAVVLADLATVKVMVPVPEQSIARVRVGDEVPVSFDALSAPSFQGRVTAIIPRADAQARTFPVQVDVPNPDGLVLAGMLARVSFAIGDEGEVVFVPKDALVPRPDGSSYLVQAVEGRAVVVPVRLVSGSGATFAVVPLDGVLKAGDRVVVRGNERLRPGQSLREASGGQG